MASTSGTYFAGAPSNNDIIEDAYERIGVLPSLLTQQQLRSALRLMNFILQEWVNKGNNLWTVRTGMIGLTNNQSAYNLPLAAIDINIADIRTSNRVLGGIPFSSAGGNAAFAFDNNPNTSCSQVAANGYISYNYGLTQNTINMVGIETDVTTNYSLVAEYSFDGINWLQAVAIPNQLYTQGQIMWFTVPVPIPANQFRVRETDAPPLTWSQITYANWIDFTITPWLQWTLLPLNVQELFFNSLLYDTNMTRLSQAEYNLLPNKGLVGRPTSFWVDRQITPIVYLWPTPISVYNCMYISYWIAIQDVGGLINNPEVPARFLEALTAALAYKLALKHSLPSERVALLQGLAEQSYITAGHEDSERVPLRIYPDYLVYGP